MSAIRPASEDLAQVATGAGVVHDVAELAMRDPLTGLPNRALFLDRLDLALRRARRRRPASIAVFFLDLDRFKVINDTLGHAAGDRLLCDVAERLRAVVRPGDTVARLGGDEFTVLCEDVVGELEAVAIAQRLVEVFRRPFDLSAAQQLDVRTSVGIALPSARDDSVASLLRDADAAMYLAKDRGRDRFELFDATMRADARERSDLQSALRRAPQRGELELRLQPIRSVATGRVVTLQALPCWIHPQRGPLDVEVVLPLAEQAGMVTAITTWMLREACRELARWRAAGQSETTVTVTIAPSHLGSLNLVAGVAEALAAAEVPGSALELLLSERALMGTEPQVAARLAELRDLGVRLAVDGFGAGYTSLARLRRFPVDTLRLDGALVGGLGRDERDADVVEALIALAHALGMRVAATAIERPEQLALLRRLGCELGQGPLMGAAGPAGAVPAILRADLQPA